MNETINFTAPCPCGPHLAAWTATLLEYTGDPEAPRIAYTSTCAHEPHDYDVQLAGGDGSVAPACSCGWTGTPVDPTTLGDPASIRAALHAPYRQHKAQAETARGAA